MDAMVAVVMRFPFAKCLSLFESLQLAVVSDGLHPFLLEKYLVTRISLQTECVQTRRDDVAGLGSSRLSLFKPLIFAGEANKLSSLGASNRGSKNIF